MNYLVFIGPHVFYGTNGILEVQLGGYFTPMLRLYHTVGDHNKWTGLTVDAYIKDKNGHITVKLLGSQPVYRDARIRVSADCKKTKVSNKDGSLIFKIEQLDVDLPHILESPRIQKMLQAFPPHMFHFITASLKTIFIDAVLQLTGEFTLGVHQVRIGEDFSVIGGEATHGGLIMGIGSIKLGKDGFAM
ncbi:hypothetical protein [Anditalea andensis]|uniref:Uncharacterized protein n=1 Tax=Anditalea andensis TaxID=1048983 RepID=A0A074KW24_9BACT|nr:hypothetical protein [Anditalea andensis]KEO71823.1 hypothetical protein EL17_21110 [Anditalea andensis]